jgi:hypothetical protein
VSHLSPQFISMTVATESSQVSPLETLKPHQCCLNCRYSASLCRPGGHQCAFRDSRSLTQNFLYVSLLFLAAFARTLVNVALRRTLATFASSSTTRIRNVLPFLI